jgi:regulator of sirC expression with transglutaminase-like and TPR domain
VAVQSKKSLSQNQQKGLAALLADSDLDTVQLVKQQLLDGGVAKLPEYYRLLEALSGPVARHLREVIEKLESAETLGSVSRLLADLSSFEQLENLCWELARAEQPAFDSSSVQRQLDLWGEALAKRIPPHLSTPDQIKIISSFFANEQRFTGNQQDYYHPRNSYLPWVIEFRKGLPLTLTLVYVLVGRRAGLEIEGISAPGHFVARLNGVNFDPYYGGRLITPAEWNRIIAEVPPEHKDSVLVASTPLEIAHRMLLNLRTAYLRRGDMARQDRIDRFLAVLQH